MSLFREKNILSFLILIKICPSKNIIMIINIEVKGIHDIGKLDNHLSLTFSENWVLNSGLCHLTKPMLRLVMRKSFLMTQTVKHCKRLQDSWSRLLTFIVGNYTNICLRDLR